MVNKAPKPFRYTIQYGKNELVLTTDPKGWQEHSIGFTRSDDFGLNVETVIALSFSKEGRNLLRLLYEQTGIFTKAFLLIEKRNNDWVYDSFYKYRLDFSTYTDSMNFIEISGIEEGLLSAFSAYKDTEYKITLPITNTIDFTGISVDRKNLIQALFGKMYEKSDLGDDVYPLGGNRSVRTYSDSLAFVDFNGEPYETMTIRCIKDITFDLHVKLNNKIIAKRILSAQAGGGDIKLIIHDTNFTIIGSPIDLTYTRSTVLESGILYYTNTTSFVGDMVVKDITLTAGQCISLCYMAENGSYAEVSNSESQDTYMEVTTLVASQYQESTLPVFTFQTLITALLAKIDANATLTYSITNANYDILLTTTNHVKVMGAQSGNVTFKAKLSDALKALNCLENIGIDISGNVLTIDYLENFYKDVDNGEIICKNIVLKHDQKHQYNKISVGYKVDERSDKEYLAYPFNCQKEFEIKEALTESAIDLVNPYIADPYEIEQTIIDTAGKVTSELDTKFIILVAIPILSDIDSAVSAENTETLDNSASEPIQAQVGVSYQIPNTRIYDSKIKVYGTCTTPDGFTATDFIIEVREQGILVDTFSGSGEPVATGYTTTNELQGNAVIDISYIQNYEIAAFTGSTFISVFSKSFFIYSEPLEIGKELYKGHTITSFNGDEATAYNLPITPKRILNKHLNYLSISNYGSPNDIAFVSSDIESAITSRIDGETADVVENANIENIAPIFLPVTIECDTVTDFSSTFSDNKYKYLKIIDQKSGKSYQGWINSITFAPTKKKSTKLILQAKSI